MSDDAAYTRTCQACGQTVLALAAKCRYCGAKLDDAPASKGPKKAAPEAEPLPPGASRLRRWVGGPPTRVRSMSLSFLCAAFFFATLFLPFVTVSCSGREPRTIAGAELVVAMASKPTDEKREVARYLDSAEADSLRNSAGVTLLVPPLMALAAGGLAYSRFRKIAAALLSTGGVVGSVGLVVLVQRFAWHVVDLKLERFVTVAGAIGFTLFAVASGLAVAMGHWVGATFPVGPKGRAGFWVRSVVVLLLGGLCAYGPIGFLRGVDLVEQAKKEAARQGRR